jgi:aminopeptidase-like protein
LCKHIYTAEDATPWVFKYYERDWGFCMPKEQFLQLPWGGTYHVDIQTTFDANKPLQVLESSTPDCDGHRKLLLVAHIDHLLQANDDLSGVAVGVEVMRRLNKNPIENATRQVRLLLVPETIGSVCYFSEPHNKDGVDGAIFLEMLGTDGELKLQTSRDYSEIDDVAFNFEYDRWGDFREIVGNDEIIINGAGINIPTISISRAPFPEYHTDKDTPVIIREDKLRESADLIEKIVRIFCTNYIPVANYEGAPFLSGYGLWEDREHFNDMHNAKVEDIFLCFDRDMSIFEIAQSVGMDYWEVYNYVERFRAKGLVTKLRNESYT